ncbi:MAG: hypothetical protein ACREUU_04150, partial [Gammaproteobacteria bacterium]
TTPGTGVFEPELHSFDFAQDRLWFPFPRDFNMRSMAARPTLLRKLRPSMGMGKEATHHFLGGLR